MKNSIVIIIYPKLLNQHNILEEVFKRLSQPNCFIFGTMPTGRHA
ncbi:hypothetical protein X975_05616, partial [Stegodyphus mimosarum]